MRLRTSIPCVACIVPASSAFRAASSTVGISRARIPSYLGSIDADFSHDPKIVPAMVAALDSGVYGLAVGSRYVPGGGITNWPMKRIVTSRVACLLAYPLTPDPRYYERILAREARGARRRRARSRSDSKIGLRSCGEGALRQSSRSTVRLYRSHRRRIQTQYGKEIRELSASARAHLRRSRLFGRRSKAATVSVVSHPPSRKRNTA